MLKGKKLSRVDIVLLSMAVITAVAVIFAFRWKANTDGERIRLETQAGTAGQNAIEAENKDDLESLSQALAKAQLALSENPFPSEEEATACTNQFAQFAQTNSVAIIAWNHSYSPADLGTRNYPAIIHSLTLTGKPNSLANFVAAVTNLAASPVVQNLKMSAITTNDTVWRMELQLIVYYHN